MRDGEKQLHDSIKEQTLLLFLVPKCPPAKRFKLCIYYLSDLVEICPCIIVILC